MSLTPSAKASALEQYRLAILYNPLAIDFEVPCSHVVYVLHSQETLSNIYHDRRVLLDAQRDQLTRCDVMAESRANQTADNSPRWV